MNFSKKTLFFPKIPKGRKLAAECDCIKKISQSIENLGLIEKKDELFETEYYVLL